MLKRPIYQSSYRYKFAQKLLYLLFGKKNMYIAPWKHTAVGAGGFLFLEGKLLLGKRADHTNLGGLYGLIGGYVDFEDNETPADALVREAFEEAQLRLEPFPFNTDTLFDISMADNQYLEGEFDNFNRLDMLFIRQITAEQASQIQDTDEMHSWAFFSLPEIETLHKEGTLACDIALVRKALKST